VIIETLGESFQEHFAFLPAQGTRGGAVLVVDCTYYKILSHEYRTNTVTAKIQSTLSLCEWWITVVYGPQEDNDKLFFLEEMRQISTITSDRWFIVGDFNMILQAQDKSSSNLNRRLMGAFRRLLDDLELKELKLLGRKYTWSNNRTHTRIERAFCTSEWDLMLPNCSLQAVSSLVSDHCPLLLVGSTNVHKFRGFRFESFWPKLPGFMEEVSQAWNRDLYVTNPFLRLQKKNYSGLPRLSGVGRDQKLATVNCC
jgi:hypothetical protein